MTKASRRQEATSRRLLLARTLAWLVVLGVTSWLLSMTLREMGGLGFGRMRFGVPKYEVNLRPFSNKVLPLHNLGSPDRAARRAAQVYLFIDVLGNVAVFVPFGASLAAATLLHPGKARRTRFWPWWLRVSVAGFALSLFIEIGQLAIPGRVTDVDDVILNTLGTAAGALVVWCLFRLFLRGENEN